MSVYEKEGLQFCSQTQVQVGFPPDPTCTQSEGSFDLHTKLK